MSYQDYSSQNYYRYYRYQYIKNLLKLLKKYLNTFTKFYIENHTKGFSQEQLYPHSQS